VLKSGFGVGWARVCGGEGCPGFHPGLFSVVPTGLDVRAWAYPGLKSWAIFFRRTGLGSVAFRSGPWEDSDGQPSLRDWSLTRVNTQDFILGYSHPSLRDLVSFVPTGLDSSYVSPQA
jgi:hypothetical protein